jgi:hypothetical protein
LIPLPQSHLHPLLLSFHLAVVCLNKIIIKYIMFQSVSPALFLPPALADYQELAAINAHGFIVSWTVEDGQHPGFDPSWETPDGQPDTAQRHYFEKDRGMLYHFTFFLQLM